MPASATRPPEHCADCRWRASGAFLPCGPEELAAIERFRSGIERVAAGGAVVAEGRLSPRLYTVYSGWAFRFTSLSDGRRQILNLLMPGDFLGLQAEFVDDGTHGVQALTELQLCAFPRSELWPVFTRQPELAYQVTWLAAKQEQLLDENLVTLGQRNAAERIAMLLIVLWRRAERLGLTRADGSMDFPLSQQHIADALGLSLVHTNKTLRRLEALGLHTIRAGRLRLIDAGALERIADYAARPLRRQPLI